MKVTVIYFAALRDAVGCSEEELEMSEQQMTAKELVAQLLKRHPSLTMEGVRVAQNEEFVDLDARIQGGDVVALIPPVSGG